MALVWLTTVSARTVLLFAYRLTGEHVYCHAQISMFIYSFYPIYQCASSGLCLMTIRYEGKNDPIGASDHIEWGL